ncbi:MAG: IS66 family insertion sequence element accessory protein TnpB [Candidatus Brocadiaceae bacterium]|nr:IS66 family insertion sequence element accessory protein TnpB [Candidatus Brocadiaceae bacterium]
MRKSFDGLFAVASQELRISPMNGDLFAFFNKNRTIVKLLFWDTGGLCIIAKRLEKGTFQIPLSVTDKIEISGTNLQLILEGINLDSISYRRRFSGLL